MERRISGPIESFEMTAADNGLDPLGAIAILGAD